MTSLEAAARQAAKGDGQAFEAVCRALQDDVWQYFYALAGDRELAAEAAQGQAGYILASDPLDSGWDLFGIANRKINFLLVSTSTIALSQVGAIVAGHIVGMVFYACAASHC